MDGWTRRFLVRVRGLVLSCRDVGPCGGDRFGFSSFEGKVRVLLCGGSVNDWY